MQVNWSNNIELHSCNIEVQSQARTHWALLTRKAFLWEKSGSIVLVNWSAGGSRFKELTTRFNISTWKTNFNISAWVLYAAFREARRRRLGVCKILLIIINCGVILRKIRYNERTNTEHRALNYRLTSNSLRIRVNLRTFVTQERLILKNRTCIYGLNLRLYKGNKIKQGY